MPRFICRGIVLGTQETARHKRFLDYALRIARKKGRREENRYLLAALVTKRGVILSTGINRKRTHPISINHRFNCLHAEMDALRKVKEEDRIGTIVYVARAKNDTESGLAKPCYECLQVLSRNGVRMVYHT